MSPYFAQPPVLSVMSGLIAVILYHFCGRHSSNKEDANATKMNVSSRTTAYLMVFLVVAILVYGSFVIAESNGGVKYTNGPDIDIQTGGRPPF